MDNVTLSVALLGVVFTILAVGIIVLKLQTERLDKELFHLRNIKKLLKEIKDNETKEVSKNV